MYQQAAEPAGVAAPPAQRPPVYVANISGSHNTTTTTHRYISSSGSKVACCLGDKEPGYRFANASGNEYETPLEALVSDYTAVCYGSGEELARAIDAHCPDYCPQTAERKLECFSLVREAIARNDYLRYCKPLRLINLKLKCDRSFDV
jgi:hypothetical protein